MLIFDIETRPQSEAELRHLYQLQLEQETSVDDLSVAELKSVLDAHFVAYAVSATKPSLVKTVQGHEAAHEAGLARARDLLLAKITDKAALSPETGRVLAMTFFNPSWVQPEMLLGRHDERECIKSGLALIENALLSGQLVLGFHIALFDLPFLFNRCAYLGIRIPQTLGYWQGDRWYWSRLFVDLLNVWRWGRHGEFISLDRLARAAGITGKERTGRDFAALLEADPEAARAYCFTEMRQMVEIAERYGLRDPGQSTVADYTGREPALAPVAAPAQPEPEPAELF